MVFKLIFSKIKKSYVICILLCILILTFSISFCFSYYVASGSVNFTGTISIPSFAPKINNNSSFSQSINLASTITNNKTLAPGAEGSFNINIDFTDVSDDVNYTISFNGTNLPNNLHFYTNSSYTNNLTTIQGTQLKQNSNKVVDNTIYWKWEYVNDSASNTNDSLYMNQSISVPFKVNITEQMN